MKMINKSWYGFWLCPECENSIIIDETHEDYYKCINCKWFNSSPDECITSEEKLINLLRYKTLTDILYE
jgi:hypothetical protein